MFKWIKYLFIKNEEAVNAKMTTDATYVEGHIKKEIAKAKTNLEKLHFAKLQSETEIKKVDENIRAIGDLLESEKSGLKKKLKDLSENELIKEAEQSDNRLAITERFEEELEQSEQQKRIKRWLNV